MKKVRAIIALLLFFISIPGLFAVKVAIIQYQVKEADQVGKDAEIIERYIRTAAGEGASLVITPETPFYRYEPWKQNNITMLDLANQYDDLVARFSSLAKELNIALITGLREPSGNIEKPVYNAALYIDRNGEILGKQRKLVPSNSEKAWTSPGMSFEAFETSFGRIGLMICKTAKVNWWNTYDKEDNLDLFVLIAGDEDGTSFDKFSNICNKANCYGILANQLTFRNGKEGKGNSACGYPDGSVEFSGGGENVFYFDLPIPIQNKFQPQAGQIMVDPENDAWLVYNRDQDSNGKPDPFFLCGPGDPEGFLYMGDRNANGTRNGEQLNMIQKLADYGGNCIYLIAVRTHGGDAWKDVQNDPLNYPDDKHNPWVGQNPAYGLNPDILEQWEIWFSEMDKHGITIYFFIYDDAINVGESMNWPLDESGELHPGERQFIEDIVNKFEHHKNLIWCVMEEGQEIGGNWKQHVSKIAETIRLTDDYDHVIASHQLPGNDFYHVDDPNIDQYAIQSASWEIGSTPDSAHDYVVKTWEKANRKFNLNMSEDPFHRKLCELNDRESIRKRSWAMALGGAYIMVFGMDIVHTPTSQLEDCRKLQRFFESVGFNKMAPHNELKYAGSQYVMAQPGISYIAYSSNLVDKIGIKDLVVGNYNLLWYDCISGDTLNEILTIENPGSQSWKKPLGFGNEVALYICNNRQVLENNRLKTSGNQEISIKKNSFDKKNTAPQVEDLIFETKRNQAIDIQLLYVDPDGGPGPYSLTILKKPEKGKLTGKGNDMTYMPSKNFIGKDSFSWKVNDGADDSEIVTVEVLVR